MIKGILLSIWLTIIGGFPYPPNTQYETSGEQNFFVATPPSGSASCLDWQNACDLKTAIAKTTDATRDVIWLGAGNHDTDNGVDGTGCTVDKDNVTIRGLMGTRAGPGLYNSNGAATHVLKTTGDKFVAKGVQFRGPTTGIAVEMSGGFYGEIDQCVFVNGPTGTITGTGLKITGEQNATIVRDCLFSQSGVALLYDDAFQCIVEKSIFTEIATGIQLAGTDESQIAIRESFFEETSAAAFDIVSTGIDDIRFYENTMVSCADPIDDNSGTFNEITIYGIKATGQVRKIYPASGTGVTITSGSGPNVFGAATTFFTEGTFAGPWFAIEFKIQDADPAPTNNTATYTLEISIGPNVSTQIVAGTAQFNVGDFKQAVGAIVVARPIGQFFQEQTAATARVKSNMAGIKNIIVTMEYFIL